MKSIRQNQKTILHICPFYCYFTRDSRDCNDYCISFNAPWPLSTRDVTIEIKTYPAIQSLPNTLLANICRPAAGHIEKSGQNYSHSHFSNISKHISVAKRCNRETLIMLPFQERPKCRSRSSQKGFLQVSKRLIREGNLIKNSEKEQNLNN